MELLKLYLPLYLVLFLILVFVIPTFRIYKKTKIIPITFGKSDTAHDYIGLIMKAQIILLFIVILIYSLSDFAYTLLVPIPYLEIKLLKIVGLIIIHFALAWIAIAQYQMNSSWRIGIDRKNKTKLITRGLFSISRNPIFLGMILSLLGVFLIVPNALSLFLTLSSYLIIQIQIRLEEEFLCNEHGQKYLEYKNKTKRLLL